MASTAKVYCNSKQVAKNSPNTTVTFAIDYSDSRNAEWAQATPWLEFRMSVKDDRFELGKSYTLTIEEDADDEAGA
jgi:hypothetical protein